VGLNFSSLVTKNELGSRVTCLEDLFWKSSQERSRFLFEKLVMGRESSARRVCTDQDIVNLSLLGEGQVILILRSRDSNIEVDRDQVLVSSSKSLGPYVAP
jgi:hypothetical protein